MTQKQNLAAKLWEGHRLRTIGDLAKELAAKPEETWSVQKGNAEATVKNIVSPDGTRSGCKVNVKRIIAGTILTESVAVEFGEFDYSTPTVDATLYDGGDIVTGDRPIVYSSVDRSKNATFFGIPNGLGRIVGALEFAANTPQAMDQEKFVDDYGNSERQMLTEK